MDTSLQGFTRVPLSLEWILLYKFFKRVPLSVEWTLLYKSLQEYFYL